jgi:hypothetical protein
MSQAVLTRHVHPKQRGIQGIAEKDKATNNQTRSVHLNNLPETGVLHKPVRLLQENRHTHTCSEKSLRIWLWNASYVLKHSNYT